MNSKAVAFVVGVAVGVGATALVLTTRPHSPEADAEHAQLQAELGTATNQVAELGEQLTAAKTRSQKLEADNLQLATKVQELMKQKPAIAKAGKDKSANPLAAMFGDEDSESGKAMKGMMEAAMKQQVEGKLGRMKDKLNLSGDQEAQIRAILEQQIGAGSAMAQKMLSGKLSKEEIADAGKQAGDPESQIKALLSPEQQTAYTELQQEEQHNNARLMANSELLQMQGALGLSQEQQDKVFQALYAQTEHQLAGATGGADPKAFNPQTMMDQKLAALKGVLTDEQFARYKAMQEQQLKLIQAFMPKDGGTTVVPSVIVKP
jgi:hypothetical protein